MPQPSDKRARLGKLLVGFAVLAPSVLVLAVYLVLQGRLYHYHLPGPLWPWIVADVAVLTTGLLLLRGQDI